MTENMEGTEERVGIGTDRSPAGKEEGDKKGKEESGGAEVLNLGAQRAGLLVPEMGKSQRKAGTSCSFFTLQTLAHLPAIHVCTVSVYFDRDDIKG